MALVSTIVRRDTCSLKPVFSPMLRIVMWPRFLEWGGGHVMLGRVDGFTSRHYRPSTEGLSPTLMVCAADDSSFLSLPSPETLALGVAHWVFLSLARPHATLTFLSFVPSCVSAAVVTLFSFLGLRFPHSLFANSCCFCLST